jgi:acetyl-CoA carboxylase carboxyltransferase component
MHAQISGTIDYREPNDEACLERLRRLIGLHRPDDPQPPPPFARHAAAEPSRPASDLLTLLEADPRQGSEVRDILACLVDAGSFDEYKAEYGQTLVCGTARLGGFPIGIVASQRHRVRAATGEYQFASVLYVDSAEKAARFVMNCNQDWLPILFLQDVHGFMVGTAAERAGIIKAGAKLVNAVSNSRVPKLTLLMGGSYGAGNYALCGKAFDPRFIFAWPTARCAVMGPAQATGTLLEVIAASWQKQGRALEAAELEELRRRVEEDYTRQTDVRYAAARLWVDAILDPRHTRQVLIQALEIATRAVSLEPFRLGVYQV